MSNIPIVSIVGRPNVGKSSLFNRILRKRVAVVDDTPGVTRDRNYKKTSWNQFQFHLVDTGGLIPTSKESIPTEINKQVDLAIQESEVIIFLVEAQPGPTDLDLLIAKKLRKNCSDTIIVAVNKAESRPALLEAGRHISLGCGDPLPISALHGMGVGDLLDRVCGLLKKTGKKRKKELNDADVHISVIGRPNAGKSSLVNKLLNHERMIVDSVPFTTRDAVDSTFVYKSLTIKIIDTAGLRKKAQVHNDIEYFSNLRALESVRRCDICLLMIDITQGVEEQDLKILNHVSRFKKGMILCFNKWDLLQKDHKTFDTLVAEYKKTYREIRHIPIVSLSALTGQRTSTVIDTVLQVRQRMEKRVKPSDLRDAITLWTTTTPHPYILNKPFRIFGVKQIQTSYPHFTFYCNNPSSVIPAYCRFLTNKIQSKFDFSGCPLIVSFKHAGKKHRNQFKIQKNNSDKEI